MKILLTILFFIGLLNAADAKYAMGKDIYETTCISCHGANGNAKTKVSFIVNPRALDKTILTQEQSYNIIKHGAHELGAAADIMPSFKSVYSEKELQSVAYYIRKAFKPHSEQRIDALYAKSDTIDASKKKKMLKRGAKIFKRNCSWCHGVGGDGAGEATRNPEMSIFPYNLVKTQLSEKQLFLYIKYGGKYWGTHKEDMPSWSKKYDDFTIKSVAKYIHEKMQKNDYVK
ncbi:c-type cytochrome [Sulfurimonas sp. SAG-AH-194-I05]|nr:c-type cytochrome [Sulfurimonas sp. SAG-AH-194-I05]MDF1875032.1 c-type cytochrome [Sulfurimonas sp. SAG-AH-194-I05]